MRAGDCGSSLSSSRAASRSKSILHAMAPDEVVQCNQLAAAFPQILETAFSEIDVFKLVKVAENRLSRINLFVRPVRLASSASRASISGGRRRASMNASNSLYIHSTHGSRAMKNRREGGSSPLSVTSSATQCGCVTWNET